MGSSLVLGLKYLAVCHLSITLASAAVNDPYYHGTHSNPIAVAHAHLHSSLPYCSSAFSSLPGGSSAGSCIPSGSPSPTPSSAPPSSSLVASPTPSLDPEWALGCNRNSGTDYVGTDICGNGGCKSLSEYCLALSRSGHSDDCCNGEDGGNDASPQPSPGSHLPSQRPGLPGRSSPPILRPSESGSSGIKPNGHGVSPTPSPPLESGGRGGYGASSPSSTPSGNSKGGQSVIGGPARSLPPSPDKTQSGNPGGFSGVTLPSVSASKGTQGANTAELSCKNGTGTDYIGNDICGNGGCKSLAEFCSALKRNGRSDPCCGGSSGPSPYSGVSGKPTSNPSLLRQGASETPFSNHAVPSGFARFRLPGVLQALAPSPTISGASRSSGTGLHPLASGSGQSSGGRDGFGCSILYGADFLESDICRSEGCDTLAGYCQALRKNHKFDFCCLSLQGTGTNGGSVVSGASSIPTPGASPDAEPYLTNLMYPFRGGKGSDANQFRRPGSGSNGLLGQAFAGGLYGETENGNDTSEDWRAMQLVPGGFLLPFPHEGTCSGTVTEGEGGFVSYVTKYVYEDEISSMTTARNIREALPCSKFHRFDEEDQSQLVPQGAGFGKARKLNEVYNFVAQAPGQSESTLLVVKKRPSPGNDAAVANLYMDPAGSAQANEGEANRMEPNDATAQKTPVNEGQQINATPAAGVPTFQPTPATGGSTIPQDSHAESLPDPLPESNPDSHSQSGDEHADQFRGEFFGDRPAQGNSEPANTEQRPSDTQSGGQEHQPGGQEHQPGGQEHQPDQSPSQAQSQNPGGGDQFRGNFFGDRPAQNNPGQANTEQRPSNSQPGGEDHQPDQIPSQGQTQSPGGGDQFRGQFFGGEPAQGTSPQGNPGPANTEQRPSNSRPGGEDHQPDQVPSQGQTQNPGGEDQFHGQFFGGEPAQSNTEQRPGDSRPGGQSLQPDRTPPLEQHQSPSNGDSFNGQFFTPPQDTRPSQQEDGQLPAISQPQSQGSQSEDQPPSQGGDESPDDFGGQFFGRPENDRPHQNDGSDSAPVVSQPQNQQPPAGQFSGQFFGKPGTDQPSTGKTPSQPGAAIPQFGETEPQAQGSAGNAFHDQFFPSTNDARPQNDDTEPEASPNQESNPASNADEGFADQFFGLPSSESNPSSPGSSGPESSTDRTSSEHGAGRPESGNQFSNDFFGRPSPGDSSSDENPGKYQAPGESAQLDSDAPPDEKFSGQFFGKHPNTDGPGESRFGDRPSLGTDVNSQDNPVSQNFAHDYFGKPVAQGESPDGEQPSMPGAGFFTPAGDSNPGQGHSENHQFSQDFFNKASDEAGSEDGLDVPDFQLPEQGPSVSTNIGDTPIQLTPEKVVIGSQTFDRDSSPSSAVVNGQNFSWNADKFFGPSASIPFPSRNAPNPIAIVGGESFTVHPDHVEVEGTSVPRPSGSESSEFVVDGQTFQLNPSQLIVPDLDIPLPSAGGPIPFVYKGQTLSADGSFLFAGTTSIPISPSGVVRYNGEDLTITASSVLAQGTSIPLTPSTTFSEATYGSLTISVAPSEVVVGGLDIKNIQDGMTTLTTVIDGQTLEIGPNGVEVGSTTIPLPESMPSFEVTTIGDVTLSLGPTEAVIDGSTYTVTPGSPSTTTIVDGQTLVIGPTGVHFEGSTVALPTVAAEITADAISIGATKAVIDGTTYAIGSNAAEQTITIGSETIRLGTEGVVLPEITLGDGMVIPETTLSPNTTAAQPGSGFITTTNPASQIPSATSSSEAGSDSGSKRGFQPSIFPLMGLHIGLLALLIVML